MVKPLTKGVHVASITRFLSAAVLVPTLAFAQGKPVVEIGTDLGVTMLTSGGESSTVFNIPGQGILGQPTIRATFFAGRSLTLEPQLALTWVSYDGGTQTRVGLGGQIGYLFKGSTAKSLYVAGSLALLSISEDNSDTDFGLGGKLGVRVPCGSSVGVRFEGGYRRWFNHEINEITLGVGVGGIVHRTK